MINNETLLTAKKLKETSDAAYLVFKKNPSIANANSWVAAKQAFTDFCISTIEALIEDTAGDAADKILTNFDKYRACERCGAELLFPTTRDNYIASSDFLEDFPGWCYPCLVEHCSNQNCDTCTVPADNQNCSFKEVKNLLTAE